MSTNTKRYGGKNIWRRNRLSEVEKYILKHIGQKTRHIFIIVKYLCDAMTAYSFYQLSLVLRITEPESQMPHRIYRLHCKITRFKHDETALGLSDSRKNNSDTNRRRMSISWFDSLLYVTREWRTRVNAW